MAFSVNLVIPQELEKLIDDSKKMKNNIKQISISMNKELTAKTYAMVKKKTPVGVYTPITINGKTYNAGKVGGTLRNAWQMSTLINSSSVKSKVYNNLEYAEYVEYGHRQQVGRYVPQIGKKLKNSFVKGQYMLTKSIVEMKPQIDVIIQKHTKKIKWSK